MNRQQQLNRIGFLASGKDNAITIVPWIDEYNVMLKAVEEDQKPICLAVISKSADSSIVAELLVMLPYQRLYLTTNEYTFCVMFENEVE